MGELSQHHLSLESFNSLLDRVKDLEARLAHAEAMRIVASSVDVMFEGLQIIGRDWRYLYVNETAATHGRAPRSTLIGRTMMECYPGIENSPMFQALERCMSTRQAQRLENQFVYPSGKMGWFDLRVEAVPEGLLILSSDITDRKHVEEELKRTRENLETTLGCMADAVITTDLDGKVVSLNPAACQLMQVTAQTGLGRPLHELLTLIDQYTHEPASQPVERVLRQGGPLALTNGCVILGANEKLTYVASSGAPLRAANGDIQGVVIVLRDVSQEHNLTEQLQHAQKLEAVGRVAGGVAHDFNNALSVILTLGQLAQEQASQSALAEPEERNRLLSDLKQIEHAAMHAAGLTRQLLAFSRRQLMKPQVLDLNAVLNNMDNMLRRVLPANIDLVTSTHNDLHSVSADPGQIEQVIMNLVVNAADAMPEGGKLTLCTANVTLDDAYAAEHVGVVAGPHVMLALSDTGCGMEAPTLARIFEPFFTTKDVGRGTGLGLSTVYGIVKQSGGDIWVYSEPGLGTTFKIYLPVATQAPKPVAQPKPIARGGTETVLLVEDNPQVRKVALRLLSRAGYRVLEAPSAEHAITICDEEKGAVALLLTDILLPGTNGPGLAELLVAKNPSLRVLFMSGYTEDAILHQQLLAPGVRFVEKPFTPETLISAVRCALDDGIDA